MQPVSNISDTPTRPQMIMWGEKAIVPAPIAPTSQGRQGACWRASPVTEKRQRVAKASPIVARAANPEGNRTAHSFTPKIL